MGKRVSAASTSIRSVTEFPVGGSSLSELRLCVFRLKETVPNTPSLKLWSLQDLIKPRSILGGKGGLDSAVMGVVEARASTSV